MAERVIVIGGGLAGLAAAQALAERGREVVVLEARNRLGGRAGSFVDASSGQTIDACQHVSMGCCTNLAHFFRTVGVDHLLAPQPELTFLTAGGKASSFRADALPAPFHLARAFLRLHVLSYYDKLMIAWGLACLRAEDAGCDPPFHDWLLAHRQTPRAIERFWGLVLVSALNESVERIGLKYARKVFVDGFLRHRQAFTVYIPSVPLDRLYGEEMQHWFAQRGVQIRLNAAVRHIDISSDNGRPVRPALDRPPLTPPSPPAKPGGEGEDGACLSSAVAEASAPLSPGFAGERAGVRGERLSIPPHPNPLPPAKAPGGEVVRGVLLRDGTQLEADWYVAAAPFDRLADMLPPDVVACDSALQSANQLTTSPITSVHLWFDGPIVNRPHVVLVDGLGQWIFNRGEVALGEWYVQVVISAARDISKWRNEEIERQVVQELRGIFPEAKQAKLIRSRVVTDKMATFSVTAGVDSFRPGPRCSIPNLLLAGDWTNTGWPATMEGAVRSGYRAAEIITGEEIIRPDL